MLHDDSSMFGDATVSAIAGTTSVGFGDLLPIVMVMTEYLIGCLFLIVRHRGIQAGKGARQLLDTVRMSLRDFRIRIKIIDRRRVCHVRVTFVDGPVKLPGVTAHRVRDFLPLGLLGGSNFELRLQARSLSRTCSQDGPQVTHSRFDRELRGIRDSQPQGTSTD